MFAYPAINITSSQTINAAIRGFAEAGSDGIIQVSTGGAEFASGSNIKNMVTGASALAAFAAEVAKNYPVNIALHTDHCPKDKLDGFVRPLWPSRPSGSRPACRCSSRTCGTARPCRWPRTSPSPRTCWPCQPGQHHP
jgi:fructose/tagatose bisphosphate aldolase